MSSGVTETQNNFIGKTSEKIRKKYSKQSLDLPIETK